MRRSRMRISAFLAAASTLLCLSAEQFEGEAPLDLEQQGRQRVVARPNGLDHHRRHRRRRLHHNHGRRPCLDHCRNCPPRDLCMCTENVGLFKIITRPVAHCQAESACAMLGLRLARIDLNNFMDATSAAFKCTGPFSQTWVKSWNGDDYGDKGIVLSTGSAAPGGAINEVLDSQFGRYVMCEPCEGPVKKPDCRGCHEEPRHPCPRRRRRHDCGCRPVCRCHRRRPRPCHRHRHRRHHREGPVYYPVRPEQAKKEEQSKETVKGHKPHHGQVKQEPAKNEQQELKKPVMEIKKEVQEVKEIKEIKKEPVKQVAKEKTITVQKPEEAKAMAAMRWFPLNVPTKDLPKDTVQILLATDPETTLAEDTEKTLHTLDDEGDEEEEEDNWDDEEDEFEGGDEEDDYQHEDEEDSKSLPIAKSSSPIKFSRSANYQKNPVVEDDKDFGDDGDEEDGEDMKSRPASKIEV